MHGYDPGQNLMCCARDIINDTWIEGHHIHRANDPSSSRTASPRRRRIYVNIWLMNGIKCSAAICVWPSNNGRRLISLCGPRASSLKQSNSLCSFVVVVFWFVPDERTRSTCQGGCDEMSQSYDAVSITVESVCNRSVLIWCKQQEHHRCIAVFRQ